jgi:ribonuclease P protein component
MEGILRREYSLRRNKEFRYVYKKGRSVSDGNLVLIYVITKTPRLKVGFSVSKKQGNSVERNRIKRRLKEAFFSMIEEVTPRSLLVFVPRDHAKDLSYLELKASAERLLKKAGLIGKAV